MHVMWDCVWVWIKCERLHWCWLNCCSENKTISCKNKITFKTKKDTISDWRKRMINWSVFFSFRWFWWQQSNSFIIIQFGNKSNLKIKCSFFSVLNVRKAFERTNERKTQEKKEKKKYTYIWTFNFMFNLIS